MLSLIGQWMYLTGQDILEDIFEAVPNPNAFDLGMIIGLVGIKMAVINKIEEAHSSVDAFHDLLNEAPKGSTCKNLADCNVVFDKIRVYTVGMEKPLERQQYHHLFKYLKKVTIQNKTILPALVNPDPLLVQEHPKSMSHGTVAEAYEIVENCSKFFEMMPSAKRRIEEFLGPEGLEYDHRVEHQHTISFPMPTWF